METTKGHDIRENMIRQYGKKKGTAIYYKSINSGRLKGTHSRGSDWETRSAAARHRGGPGIMRQFKQSKKHRARISESLRAHHDRRRSLGYNPAAHSV